MNRQVNAIAGRLSLRAPQRQSLEILDRVAEIISLKKGADLADALRVIQSEFPSVTDFERDFPSLCFALATGVGKTRLMGAFISYLKLAHNVSNFFVLAPNLTIYTKLITDFTPGTPKYVFQGIAELATNPPELITGDNYESGRGVRGATLGLYGDETVNINVFNISKINTEVRRGSTPRIKRLSEYIGQSYFDYLADLPDLVLLMDESHRYRASAGVRAINELKPILGLELTATPYTELGPRQVPFKNVVVNYPLGQAMADGFVKEPAVATKDNFDPESYRGRPAELELLKLQDGVGIHEEARVMLETYARQNDLRPVKPFMLVVARDTEHAASLVKTIQADAFFDGRYRERVITVHSNQRGAERDETVQRLLAVESPDEPTEIVVHVNMLKEGWDVTNLYTIVPLRAANSRTLVEQSIGRGLRLPYGKRTGVPAVDRLTVVAHDRFQDIVDEANRADSLFKTVLVIGRDIAAGRKESVTVQPGIVSAVAATPESANGAVAFPTAAERAVAAVTLQVVLGYETLASSSELLTPSVTQRVVSDVRGAYALAANGQARLDGFGAEAETDVAAVVQQTLTLLVERSIDIPRIVVQPKGEVTAGFAEFDLDTTAVHLQPVDQDILIQYLRTNERTHIRAAGGVQLETRLEDYLVRRLIDFDDVSYDEQAELLYRLAAQMVAHLQAYLPDEDAVLNVLRYHDRTLAENIHAQMLAHYWERATQYETTVTRGFTTLRATTYAAPAGEPLHDVHRPVDDRQYIRNILFGGFKRCLYPIQKFDSDAERRFAVLLEGEPDASLKWFKPARGQFQLYYGHDDLYEPDFAVETAQRKFLCEPKRRDEMNREEVQSKARAAAVWCRQATEHEQAHGGKPWSYLLIPHDAITAATSLAGLASYAVKAD